MNITIFKNIDRINVILGAVPLLSLAIYVLFFIYTRDDDKQMKDGNRLNEKVSSLFFIYKAHLNSMWTGLFSIQTLVTTGLTMAICLLYTRFNKFGTNSFSVVPIILGALSVQVIKAAYIYFYFHIQGKSKIFNTMNLISNKKDIEFKDELALENDSILRLATFAFFINILNELFMALINQWGRTVGKVYENSWLFIDVHQNLYIMSATMSILYHMLMCSIISKAGDVMGDIIAYKLNKTEDTTGSVFDKLDNYGDVVSDEMKGIFMLCLYNLFINLNQRSSLNMPMTYFYAQRLVSLLSCGVESEIGLYFGVLTQEGLMGRFLNIITSLVYYSIIKNVYYKVFLPFITDSIPILINAFEKVESFINNYLLSRNSILFQYYITTYKGYSSSLVFKFITHKFLLILMGLSKLLTGYLYEKAYPVAHLDAFLLTWMVAHINIMAATLFYHFAHMISIYINGNGNSLSGNVESGFETLINYIVKDEESVSLLRYDLYKTWAPLTHVVFNTILCLAARLFMGHVWTYRLAFAFMILTEFIAPRYDTLDSVVKSRASYQLDMDGNTLKYNNKMLLYTIFINLIFNSLISSYASSLVYMFFRYKYTLDVKFDDIAIMAEGIANITSVLLVVVCVAFWNIAYLYQVIPHMLSQEAGSFSKCLEEANKRNKANGVETEDVLQDEGQVATTFFNAILHTGICAKLNTMLFTVFLTPMILTCLSGKLPVMQIESIAKQALSTSLEEWVRVFFNSVIIYIDFALMYYNIIFNIIIYTFSIFEMAKGSIADNVKKVLSKNARGNVSNIKKSYVLAGDRLGDVQKDLLGNVIHLSMAAFVLHHMYSPWNLFLV